MYVNFVCDIKPQKAGKHRVRFVIDRDYLEYSADSSSPAVNLLDTKIHLNNVILDVHKGAQYGTANIQYFYLHNSMLNLQYMRIPSKYFFPALHTKYNIDSKVHSDN